MSINKNYITLVHEFAANNVDGFTKPGLMNYLSQNGVDINNQTFKDNFDNTFNTVVFGRAINGVDNYFIKADAYYRHLDYLEMKAARDNAKDARKWSVIAIAVSGLLALVQVVLTLIQICSK